MAQPEKVKEKLEDEFPNIDWVIDTGFDWSSSSFIKTDISGTDFQLRISTDDNDDPRCTIDYTINKNEVEPLIHRNIYFDDLIDAVEEALNKLKKEKEKYKKLADGCQSILSAFE